MDRDEFVYAPIASKLYARMSQFGSQAGTRRAPERAPPQERSHYYFQFARGVYARSPQAKGYIEPMVNPNQDAKSLTSTRYLRFQFTLDTPADRVDPRLSAATGRPNDCDTSHDDAGAQSESGLRAFSHTRCTQQATCNTSARCRHWSQLMR